MDFDFSPEQRQIQHQAHRFLFEQCGTQAARQVMESDHSYDARLWQQVVELGWTGITIPEAYGGLGLGYLELCLLAEELGRFVAPIPFSSSVYLATEALLTFGNEEQKEKWLPLLASGECVGTLAISEGLGDTLPLRPACRFIDGTISGEKSLTPDGQIAHIAIVLAADDRTVGLFIVDLASDTVHRSPLKVVDTSRGLSRLRFLSTPAERLVSGWKPITNLLDRAAVLMSFEQIGGADACLEMAKNFALGRQVFGRTLGSYQAIKHKLADMYVNNQIARSNAYYGAWALSAGNEVLPLAAALARVSAIQAFHYAAKENLQTHGGMGFTWEADCHLFYRRAKHLGLILGGERSWKERMLRLARPDLPSTQKAAE